MKKFDKTAVILFEDIDIVFEEVCPTYSYFFLKKSLTFNFFRLMKGFMAL